MAQNLISLFASIIAGSLIMIFHELPKAIIYNIRTVSQNPKQKNHIWRVHHYIDPIGLIFCVTTCSGFSKPYMYRIKEKKTNFILGIAGFVSLFIVFIIGLLLMKANFNKSSMLSYSNFFEFFYKYLSYSIVYFTTLMSLAMFIVNLFPVSTFDMGLLIAGKSPNRYFTIIQNDSNIKVILILVIVFDLIRPLCSQIIELFLT